MTSLESQRQPLPEEESGLGVDRERPRKTAMVKRELMFTMESRAVTCTVVLVFAGNRVAVLVAGFGVDAADPDPDPDSCL